MAHDVEHPSQAGSRGNAPEGLSATARAINMALAELQSEWAPAGESPAPNVETPPPPAPPVAPPPSPVATAPAPPAPVEPGPSPSPVPPPSATAEPPKPAPEPPPPAEPDRAGASGLTLPRDRIYSMSVPGRTPAPRRPSKAGKLAASIAVPLICGIIGAWAYEHLFGGSPSSDTPTEVVQQAQVPEKPVSPIDIPPPPDKIAPLKSRIDRLADRVDMLTKELDTVSKKPEPTADLAAIRRRLEGLDEAVAEIKTLEVRVNRIDERLSTADKSPKADHREPTDLPAKAEKPERLATPATLVSSTSPSEAESRDVAGPVLLDVFGEDEMMEKGTDSFKKGKYKDAADIFRLMEQADPDDARVWYFAALTRGLATGQWDGETTRLAEKGVERERSGKPGTALIDAAFRDLTHVTGKEWLAYYRTRASSGK